MTDTSLTANNTNNASPFKLRDYTHASKVFLSEDGYALVPKFGFLFIIRFELGEAGQSQSGTKGKTISVLAKRVDLPKFDVDTSVLNRYNKKEIIQKKISYQPISLTFHDDAKNTIRDFWIAYNSFYYADSSIPATAWELNDTYLQKSFNYNYGLNASIPNQRFLKNISIYSMGNHTYTKYSLVNPILSNFNFDTHDYSEGNKIMEIKMDLEYESVLYYEGKTEEIPGFGKDGVPYYDTTFSTLGNKTQTNSVSAIADNIEKAIVKQTATLTEQSIPPTIQALPMNSELVNVSSFKQVAESLLHNDKAYSFPTAAQVKNMSSLVSLTQNLTKQGNIKTTTIVVSNNDSVSSAAPSSHGMLNNSNIVASSLIISPKVPVSLTDAEKISFLNAYPSLPSTDARTRMPPYV